MSGTFFSQLKVILFVVQSTLIRIIETRRKMAKYLFGLGLSWLVIQGRAYDSKYYLPGNSYLDDAVEEVTDELDLPNEPTKNEFTFYFNGLPLAMPDGTQGTHPSPGKQNHTEILLKIVDILANNTKLLHDGLLQAAEERAYLKKELYYWRNVSLSSFSPSFSESDESTETDSMTFEILPIEMESMDINATTTAMSTTEMVEDDHDDDTLPLPQTLEELELACFDYCFDR